ncbi:prepilin-type N-terminal cleavage/methylation domain-containing protein [Planctomycetales bacterium ZRK34]|nr:prepilin-type N-terminal cleavage/methylation domain-containing protein [Planctomycetales bacterium ZRK34]
MLGIERSGTGPRGAWGFTLIELLVALGIIAIMVAILIPVLSSGAASGRLTTCMAHQRKISQQVDNFLVDHMMIFPTQQELGKVFDDYSVLDPEDDNPFLMPGPAIGLPDDVAMSYAFNIELQMRPMSMTQITRASTTLLIYDGFAGSSNGTGDGNGQVNGANKSKVTTLHKPGTPAAKVLTLPSSAIGGHLSHGDLIGSWEDLPVLSYTDMMIDDFNPRHDVDSDVGVTTFVDGHAEYRPRLDESMFIAPDSNPANAP